MNEPDQSKSVFDNLGIEISEEEQKVLDSLQAKFMAAMNSQNISEINPDNTKIDPLEDNISPRHVTDYPREIRIMVDMEMSGIDKETGMLKEVVKVLQEWYHIPILENTDYTEKAAEFMNALDNTVNTLAHKIHLNDTPETQQEKPKE